MKLLTSLTTLALALSASAAPAAVTRCEIGRAAADNIRDNRGQPWIEQLFSPCVGPAKNFWSSKACIAAAIAMGPRVLADFATCDKADTAKQSALPALDQSLFASLGEITPQTLLDLVYGQLSAVGANIYPADGAEVLDDVIGPVFTWAGESPITYARFNQWLHVSGYPGTIIDGTHTDGKTYFYDHESDSA
ncbi:hypothetical protein PENSPDRAFT_681841 [Peniophora sp. CONT]|nr:hypothetical protein PENSPDRAFT_681841 [Peniophora sp. CONT]